MVERRRREQAPQAQVTLDEKGRILEGLLPDALGEFEPEIAASFDLVEATVKPDCVPPCARSSKRTRTWPSTSSCACAWWTTRSSSRWSTICTAPSRSTRWCSRPASPRKSQYSLHHIGLARRRLVRARGARPVRGGLRRPSQHDATSAVRGVRGIPRPEEL